MPTKTIHNNTAEKWEKSNHAKTKFRLDIKPLLGDTLPRNMEGTHSVVAVLPGIDSKRRK